MPPITRTRTNAAGATAATTSTPAASQLSFAELAKTRAAPLLSEILADAKALRADAMPHEPEAKALRKKVARLRDVLDVFVHAWGGPQEKTWKRVRDRVDDGYEALGHFKDLYDSQELDDPTKAKYDARILQDRRDAVNTWKRGFLDATSVAEMQRMVDAASAPQHVDQANLTRFFWGAVSVEPNPQMTGLENTKALGSALVDEAAASLAALVKSNKGVRGDPNEDEFHDVRKRLRSIANLAAAFPEIIDDATKAKPLLEAVSAFVSRFGDVEDRLVGMHIAMEERDAQAIPGKQKLVDDSWAELKKEIGAKKLAATLRSLGALI